MKDKHRDRRRFGLRWVSVLVILAMLTPVFAAFAEVEEESSTLDAEYDMVSDESSNGGSEESSHVEAAYDIVEEEQPFDIGEKATEGSPRVTTDNGSASSDMGNGDYRADDGNGDYRAETDEGQAQADGTSENPNPETADANPETADANPDAAQTNPDGAEQDTNWNEETGSLEDAGDAVIVGFKVNHASFELAARPELDVALDYLAETVKVRAILSTGDEVNVAANWSCDDEAAYAAHDIGAFPFTGWVDSATIPVADGVQMPSVVIYVKYISEIKIDGENEITVEGQPDGNVADMPNNLGFPTTVTAVVEGAETESVTIPVSWVCVDEGGDNSGEYLFSAQLEGDVPYLMEESVTMPAMLATFDLTRETEADGYEKTENDDGSYDLFVTGKVVLKGAKIMKNVTGHIDTDDEDEWSYEDEVLEDLKKIGSIVVESGAELTMVGSFTLKKNLIVESGGVLNIGYGQDSYDSEGDKMDYGYLHMSLTNYGTIEVESSGIVNNFDKLYNGKVSNGKGRAGKIVIDGFFYNYGEVYTCYRHSKILPSPDAIIYKSTKENIHYNTGDDEGGNTDYHAYDAGDRGYYGSDLTYRVREAHRFSEDGTCMYCGMRRVEMDIRIAGDRLDKVYDGTSYVNLPGGTFTAEENDNGYMSIQNIKNGDEVSIGKFKATYHFGKLADNAPSDAATVNSLLSDSQTLFANTNTMATEIQEWLTSDTAAMMSGTGRDNWWVYLNILEDDISYDSDLYVYTYNRARHDAIPGIIYPRNINDPAVTVEEIEDQTYDDGKAVEPEVTVRSKFDGKLTQVDEDALLGDYELTFENNKKATSKARAVITGIGNYTGTRVETFKIKKEGGGGSSSSEEEDDEEETPAGPKPGELYFDALDGSDRVVNLGYVVFDDFNHPYPGYVHSEDAIVAEASISTDEGFEEEGEGYGTLPETGYYRLTIKANPVTDPITGVATTLAEDPSREKYALLHLRLSPSQINILRQERFTEVVYVIENSELRIPLSTLSDTLDIAPIKRAQQMNGQNGASDDEEWGDATEEAPDEDEGETEDETEGEEVTPVADDTELTPEMISVTNYVFTIQQLEKAGLSPRENNALKDRKDLLPLYRVAADVYDQMLPVVELQTATTTNTSDDEDDEDEDYDTSDTLVTGTDLSALPMPVGYPVLSQLVNVELRVKGEINVSDIQTFLDEAGEADEDAETAEDEEMDEDFEGETDEFEDMDETGNEEAVVEELPENVKGMIVADSINVMDEDAVEVLEKKLEYLEDTEDYSHYVRFTPTKSGMYAVVLDMSKEEMPEEPEFETEADDIEEYYAYNREIPDEGTQYWLFDTEAKIVEYYDAISESYLSGDYTGTLVGGMNITWEDGTTATAGLKFEGDYAYVEMTQAAAEEAEAEPMLLTLVEDPDEILNLMQEHR